MPPKKSRPILNRPRKGSSQLIRITEPHRLAEAISAAVDDKHGGSVRAAALAIGVSQPTLHRLTNPSSTSWLGGGARSIQKDVLDALHRLLGKEIDALFLSPEARVGLEDYKRWMRRAEAQALVDEKSQYSKAPSSTLKSTGLKKVTRFWRGRMAELGYLLGRLKTEVPHVFQEIAPGLRVAPEMNHGLAALITAFRSTEANPAEATRGISGERWFLSVLRIVEPLLEVADTGWIELRGDELSRQEFRKFVEAGWAREKILLRRDSDMLRAQRL